MSKSLLENSKLAKQGIDFTGVQSGKISPSDIDAVLEFNNKLLIMIEAKAWGKPLGMGQRLLLTRIADAWNAQEGKLGIVAVVWHQHNDEDTDIPLRSCFVHNYYFRGQWVSAKEMPINKFLTNVGKYAGIKKCTFKYKEENDGTIDNKHI